MTPSDGASIASKTLLGLIQAIPAERTAVIAPDQNVRITYGGLRTQIQAVAEALAAAGVNRGDRIGMALPNGLPNIVTFLAASLAGTAAPLNPAYRQDEFRFYLEDTNARVLLLPPEGLDEARAAAGDIPILTVDMDAAGTVDSQHGQALTRRWTQLMMRWMRGDFALLERWGAMYRDEPSAPGMRGAPPADMIEYMERAIAFRFALLCTHFTEAEIKAIGYVPDAQFAAIEAAGQKLLAAGASPRDRRARALLKRWDALLDQTCAGDPAIRRKLQTMHQAHPLLLAGHPLGPEVRRFLQESAESA